MKFCEYCGEKVLKNDKFCSKCGKEQGKTVKSNTVPAKSVPENTNEGMGVASMILGIISLVFSFIINIFVIPVAIIGLILGIVNKAGKGKRVSGIILNCIAIFVSIIMFAVWLFIFGSVVNSTSMEKLFEKSNYSEVMGTWNCKEFGNPTADGSYKISVKINDGYEFVLGDYDKFEDNYIKGSFHRGGRDEKREVDGTYLASIELEGHEKYEKKEYVGYNDDDYDMIFSKFGDKKKALLIDDNTDKVYSCELSS